MATGYVDYSEMVKFLEKLESFRDKEKEVLIESCAKELAARLLQKVIPRTPVGDYSNLMPGYERDTAGTLRRNWTGGKDMDAKAFADTLKISKLGNTYTITVENPTKYASFVEFGHSQTPGRYVPAIGKSLKKGWIEGQSFLTISENEIRGIAPSVLEKKMKQALSEVFR